MLHDIGKNREALDTLSPLLANTEDSNTLSLGADIVFELDDYPEAKRLAGLALAADEQNYDALTRFALSQARLRDKGGALLSGKELVRRHPDFWAAHTQFAMIQIEIGWVAATTLEAAREGVRQAPDQSVAHATLGDVYHSLGKKKQAATAYREALRLDPSSAHAQHNLAVASMSARPESVQDFAAILATNPDWELAAFNLTAAVASALRVLHLVLVGIFLATIAAVLVMEAVAPEADDMPIAVRILFVLFSAILVFVIVRWSRGISQRTPRAARSLLRAVARRDPLLVFWALPLGAMSLLVIIAPLLPGGFALLPFLLMWPLLLTASLFGGIRALSAWSLRPKQ